MIGDEPTIGRIVRYVEQVHGGGTLERAAIIVAVGHPQDEPDKQTIALWVFGTDLTFHESVGYDEGNSPDTWHWPPR